MQINWPTKKLGEVLGRIVGGGTPSKSISSYWDGDIPWASVKDIKEGVFELIKTQDHITKEGLAHSSATLVPIGTLIISTRMGLGRVVKTKINTAINQDLKALFPKKCLDTDYLLFYLRSKTEEISQKGSGATVSGIRLEHIKNLEIPLPPLPEQKKIVAKLEKLLAKTKEAKRLRAEAIEATDKLLSAELNQIFEEGKKRGWEVKKLKDLTERTEIINPQQEFKSDFNYIDITSVSSNRNSTPDANLIPIDHAPSRARKLVKEGDTIFATTRPYLRNIAYVTKELSGSVASTGFCVIRSKSRSMDPRYLFQVVTSSPFVDKVSSFQKGATYPAVADSVIFDQNILLPPLSEQQKIVARLDALSEKIRKLKELQQQTKRDLEALERGILERAFKNGRE
ncbi:MAG: restriction endonuclease subunit S [Patescibacteria group bacterium]|nr:restriction endonuclease subunit S [Patescibacteria group bacterium]